MNNVGFIGWRGIVGSVLMNRMLEKNNFNDINPIFFSTSNFNKLTPFEINGKKFILQNAYDLKELNKLDIIITCQGKKYTNDIYYNLKNIGWKGYWIDSSSSLRMDKSSIIALDPINYNDIKNSLKLGIKTFSGCNCTTSLMLLSLKGLFINNLIEWISFSTYQAVSGIGSKAIYELLVQSELINNEIISDILNKKYFILDILDKIKTIINSDILPKNNSITILLHNLIPWIGEKLFNGQTTEESKYQEETNKILNINNVNIDGVCVRIDSLRCHSQSFIIKLKKNIPIQNIKEILLKNNFLIKIIPNEKVFTINKLNPIYVDKKLFIYIGRIRKLNIGNKYLSLFVIGDQLLWGAAEPLRRMLCILLNKNF